MTEDKSGGTQEALSNANKTILKALKDRRILLKKARENELKLTAGAAVVLQANDRDNSNNDTDKVRGLHPENPKEILEAVEYRLAITDLFVEKAQFHLEDRAGRYKKIGYALYGLAILMFVTGTVIACNRMYNTEKEPVEIHQQSVLPKIAATSVLPSQSTTATLPQTPTQTTWIDLLRNFIMNFTAYGFIVLTAVILTRGARACLDQRERLLAKRHSLRQGRLYLHLSGGNVTINDMERAFNWNHEQQNAFTNMSTDAKAPWGNVVEEIIKIVPELVKTGFAAAEKKNMPGGKG